MIEATGRGRDVLGEAPATVWVDRGPRVRSTLEMDDAQLRALDPGASKPKRIPDVDTPAILRLYAHEQREAERRMPTGVAR